jgi:plastocyanin
VTDSKNNVYLAIGETLLPSAKSGDSFSGQPSGSGLLLPGQSFALKFPKAGVYRYFCAIHPGQLGTIVVLPASK